LRRACRCAKGQKRREAYKRDFKSIVEGRVLGDGPLPRLAGHPGDRVGHHWSVALQIQYDNLSISATSSIPTASETRRRDVEDVFSALPCPEPNGSGPRGVRRGHYTEGGSPSMGVFQHCTVVVSLSGRGSRGEGGVSRGRAPHAVPFVKGNLCP